MTKIRTQEHLEDALDAALAWRKRELAVILGLIRANTSTPARADFLMRSGITLLYAHWEGFVKDAGMAYLRYVASQGLRFRDLSSNFVAIGMKSKLNAAAQTNRATVYVRVAEFFVNGQDAKCIMAVDEAINTQANLNSAVFEDVVCLLGLDSSPFLTKSHLINEQLLGNRNRVSHGEPLLMNLPEYMQVHTAVVQLLDLFRIQISSAAALSLYKRKA